MKTTTDRQSRDREATKRLGDVIRSRRNELGLTLVDLAAVSDMTWSQLARIERGESATGPGTYERIAQELGWSAGDLFGRALPGLVRSRSRGTSRRPSNNR